MLSWSEVAVNESIPWIPICVKHIDELFAPTKNSSTTGNYTNPGILCINIILPIICFFGISGNTLNLVVLTKKRMNNPLRRLEKAASVGLTALALSDLLFCACVFPYPFFLSEDETMPTDNLFVVYYRLYGISMINLFLMTSTWLIVELALERYIVLYYPLRAKCVLGIRRTKAVIVCVFGVSFIATLPYFLQLQVSVCQGFDSKYYYELEARWESPSPQRNLITLYQRWVWPFIAVFIPLTLLLFCNVRLIQGLRRVPTCRKKLRSPSQPVSAANNRITLTLIIIVFMAIMLVTPSEILKLLNPYELWGVPGHIAANVANLLQTVNFAVNFILYCTLDVHFRRICKHIVLGRCARSRHLPVESDFLVLHLNNTSFPAHRVHGTSMPEPQKLSREKLYS